MEKTVKIASLLNRGTGEVRHLLMDEVSGAAHTDLLLFTDNREDKLFSGTEYESRQKADELGQAWTSEGFEWTAQDQPPYEPLEPTLRLAMRLGHDAIYDPRLVQTDLRKPHFNPTGLIPLKDWPGMQAKKGGTYKYAVSLMSILAEPQLPPGYPLEMSSQNFAQQMLKAIETKRSVGPSVEFLFADSTVI